MRSNGRKLACLNNAVLKAFQRDAAHFILTWTKQKYSLMSILHHSEVSLRSSPGAWPSAEDISAPGHAFHMHHHCKHLTKAIQSYTQTSLQLDGEKFNQFRYEFTNMKITKIHQFRKIFSRKGPRRNLFKNLPSCTKLLNHFFEAPIPSGWHCAISTLQLAYVPCNQHWHQLQHKDVSWCASQLAWPEAKSKVSLVQRLL